MWKRIKVFLLSFGIRLGIFLKNTDDEVFKPFHIGSNTEVVDINRTTHPLLAQFKAGEHDQVYKKYFYEVLKKADIWYKNATKSQMMVAADKWGMNIGQKDMWGRRYDHIGFYDWDENDENYGKTLGDVLQEQANERRTNDDNYKLEFIIPNEPYVQAFKDDVYVNEEGKIVYTTEAERAKLAKFPIRVKRKEEVRNEIEKLTEFLHVKIIADGHRFLLFFVPRKFKTHTIKDDDPIIKQLTDIEMVWFKNEFGDPYYYSVEKYMGRFPHQLDQEDDNKGYEVFKFKVITVEYIG